MIQPLVGLVRSLGLAGVLAAVPLAAQTLPPHTAPSFDPSDVYFQGWLQVRDAEKLENKGDFVAALEKLERAGKLFNAVAASYPDWKQAMVTGRITSNIEAIERVRPQAQAQRQPEAEALAELEGPLRRNPNGSAIGSPRNSASAQQADLARRAAQPVLSELNRLGGRIAELERERDATARALQQSQQGHEAAKNRIASVEAELARVRQQAADLERNIDTERRVANEVIRGQQEQLRQLHKTIEEKDRQLAAARSTIGGLEQSLAETRAAFGELRDERDALLRERDHMKALLQLNEAGRIQELIDQNMALAKDLRQANERFERLNNDSNATKDVLTEALRDLAIAKARIIDLQKKTGAQQERLESLEERLRRAGHDLAGNAADPEEVEMLRDIIRRQIRIQERRRQARKLLLEQVARLSLDDEGMNEAIALLEGEELRLSPEESQLLNNPEVDGEFISPFAVPADRRDAAMSRVERERLGLDQAGSRAFSVGRLNASEELFGMILDAHPGHVPSLLKLGVVRLKLNDDAAAIESFRDAVAMDGENAYGRRMLGVAFYRNGNHADAETELRHSLAINPTDAKAHVFLGNVTFRQGRKDEAERHFKNAIEADPTLNEPYFNLATLCAGEGRTDEGRDYYQQALDNGGLPDPSLEQHLGL